MTQEQIEQAAREYSELLPQGRVSRKYSAIDFTAGAKWVLSHQWISVDKESPKKSGTYFIKTKIGYGIAIYNCNGGWFDIDGKPFTKITHWMEKPPTEGGE